MGEHYFLILRGIMLKIGKKSTRKAQISKALFVAPSFRRKVSVSVKGGRYRKTKPT